MTLALYGKSKRRQGSLLLLGLLAVVLAMFASMGQLTGASASEGGSSTATIKIKKVVTGTGYPANPTFKADVIDRGPNPEVTVHDDVAFYPSSASVSVTANDNDGHDDDDDDDHDDFKVIEIDPGAGWTTKYWKGDGDESCPGTSTQEDINEWDNGREAKDGYLDGLDGGNTVTVCFHKYLPMDNVNNPWQNQGAGQGDWKYTIYADNGGAPGAVLHSNIDHLNPSPAFPKQTVWIKETDTDGDAFYGWFVPDGDNNSGNDKCNQAPANFSTGNPDARYSTDEYLKIDSSFFDTTGNATGLFHICAYNKPGVVESTGQVIVKKVGKDIPSGLLSTEFSGTVTGANHNGSWSAKVGGVDATNDGLADGQYTVTETSWTGPVTDGTIEPDGYEELAGDAPCPDPDGSNYDDDGVVTVTVAEDTHTVCVLNKFIADPTLTKVKGSGGVTPGGLAYWDVKVDNTANTADSVDVFIKDSGATLASVVSGGSCTGTDLGAGVPCTVNAGSILILSVTKPAPSAQCLPGKVNNRVRMWLGDEAGDKDPDATAGGTPDTKYDIPGDRTLCGQPSITKKLVTGGTEPVTVTDPANIAWTVVVTNPATLPGANQTVVIRDEDVVVTSGPSFTGGADCDPNSATADFQAGLTSASGVSCDMPGDEQLQSTITFTVKPVGIARTCEDQKFNNTAYLYIGSTTNTPLTAQGPEITLQGDPNLCTRNLTICKVVEGNGDLAVRSGQFKFDYYPQGGPTLNVGINASEPNPDETPGAAGTKVCTTQPIPMPIDKQLTVTEWMGQRPAGWLGDATGYPKVQQDAGSVSSNVSIDIPAGTSDVTVTFYNREKLSTKNVTFQKYICDTLGDVARNEESGGVDQVGMPSISAGGGLSGQLNQTAAPAGGGDAVNPSNDGRGNCHLWGSDLNKYPEETGTWDIKIYDNGRNEPPLQTVNIPQGGTISVQLLDNVLLEALKPNSTGARVEEVFKTGYGFASLKCYTDHKNQDNWEWLDFNPGGIPEGEVYCIAYNVKADKEIVIEKRFIGAESWDKDDIPTFTFSNPSIEPVCEAVLNASPNHVYIVCTVPYGWNGTVTETPPEGWQEVQCENPTSGDGLIEALSDVEPYEVFCNRPVGTVVIVKYENVPPATTQNWTFNGTLPGAPVVLGTTGTTNATGTASQTLTNVPAGTYTLAELEGRGQCESGTTSSDFQTRGLTSSSLPSATDVNGAPIIGASSLNVTVEKGKTTYVAFGNQGCGTVLSAANLQVIKYSDPAANFTGTTELAGWTISITGTAGAATGFNASQATQAAGGTLFLGIPDGTYTVCETAQAGWAVVGSKWNAVNQAGVCRTGVVVNLDQTAVVNFYNQPRVNIEVNKTEISLATPAGAPGNGWSFTLTGCGVGPLVQATGANGKATFTDLPPAVGCSYTVTETVKSGWSAINPVQVAAPTAAGQTAVLNFTNVKIEVCTNCITTQETPTPTPETPTATATPKTPTPETPTATPETPTQKPTEEATAGARTPGPGQTPIAPSTGNGFMGNGPAGVNMLLALIGLAALSLGTTILALGRRSSRR